jgi:DNA invertase Pin-like site-specific DNA recombinase
VCNVEEREQVRRWAKKHKVTLICCVSGGEVNLDDENGVFNFQLNTMLSRRETAATSRRIREMFERTVIPKGTSLGGKPRSDIGRFPTIERPAGRCFASRRANVRLGHPK